MAGHALYPPAASYFVDNYPPLSFYVVGLLGRVTGDMIVAGRIGSLLSFLAVAAGIAWVVQIMGAGRQAAVLAALFFAAMLLVATDYVGMDDPQMLGHALDMAALLLLLRGRDWPAALVFVIAIFVKHNLVAMPLAAALWLVLQDRHRGARFVAAGIVFSLLGLGAFRLVYGSSLLSHLASARMYSPALVESAVGAWLVWAAIPLFIVLRLAAIARRERFVQFALLYVVVAVAIGIAFSGGAGVDANVFFDADIALALGIALALERSGATWAAAVLILPLLAGLYVASDSTWRDRDFWLHPMAADMAETQGDIAFLKARKGPALCETLAFCYWAGKDEEVDVFNVGQEIASGARSDYQLDCMLEGRAFSAIEFDSLDAFSLTPGLKRALLHAYRIDHADDEGVFLVPR
jgi:hypothetical protein